MSFLKKEMFGIFIPKSSGYIGIHVSGSIIDIINHLGYNEQQIYVYHNSGGKSDIQVVGLKIFSREVVFIVTAKRISYLSQRAVKQFLADFSVAKLYDGLRISELLEDGIVHQSLTLEFLSKTLNLRNPSSNGVFYSEKIKTYLYFTDGILTNYQFDDGLFPWAKNLKKHNKFIYDSISKPALRHRYDDPFLAFKEINIQAQAWALIPHAGGNEFVSLHTNNGAINFQMLRVCHYNEPITKHEFEELNHGRFQEISLGDNIVVYQLGNFQYKFLKEGDLVELWRI